MSFNTIIIGSGWAGVVAARHLSAAGRSVLVLEGRDRIGGRAFTLADQPGQTIPVDLGCSAIHGYNEGNPVREIAQRLGVRVTVAAPKPQAILAPIGGFPGKVDERLGSNFGRAVAGARDHARETTSNNRVPLSSYIFDSASPLFEGLDDTQTKYAMQYANMLQIPLGTSLDNVSMQWYNFEDNFAGSDGAPEGGFQSLVTKVLGEAQAAGAKLHLGEKVSGVSLDAQSGNVQVTSDKETYTAQTVICTIPLGVLQSSVESPKFSPALPARREAVIARTKVGALNKAVVSYPSAWWPQDSGSFVLLPEDDAETSHLMVSALPSLNALLKSATILVLPITNSSSPDAMLMLLIGGDAAITLERLNPSSTTLTETTHAYLTRRILPSSDSPVPAPTHAFSTRWSSDPYSLGATTTPVQVGNDLSPLDFEELGKPLWGGKLGFSGEHTSIHHRGSIAGAAESGVREGERVERLFRLWEEKQ